MIKFELPYPPRVLSPNVRKHWTAKCKAKQDYSWAVAAVLPKEIPDGIHLDITFHPPSKRRVDLDNCLASIKPAIDVMSKKWKIDDSIFTYSLRKGGPVKGGKIVIHV